MTGKQKCRILKEIRRQIAEQNDIFYVTEECKHKGKCRGTCPKCEWEVRMLERELEKRRLAGKKVVLVGISAGFLMTSCSPIDTVKELIRSAADPLEWDVAMETLSGSTVPETTEGDILMNETEDDPAAQETGMMDEEIELSGEPVIEGLLPVPDETEDCMISEITEEEEYMVAGGIMPYELPDEENEEEPFLEDELIPEDEIEFAGVPVWPGPEDGELP